MVEVRLEKVTKTFGKVIAVDNASLTFEDKKLTTVVGPSGCGKTTLLRLVAGLETPTGGNIYIGDKLVNEVPPWDRNIAMVFQSYALYPHMNVFDNIAFPLKAAKCPKEEIKRRVKQTAELLDIPELLSRRPRELSGGQMQRVAIGRAIVREPEVFLMDEPLSNLDAKLRVYMRAEIKRLQRVLGVTTIYVTHDQAEAMTIGDTLVVMDNGAICCMGGPETVYSKPVDTFVATFIGSPAMNLLEGDFESEKSFFVTESLEYELPRDVVSVTKEKCVSKVILGIRPEDVTVSDSRVPGFIRTEVYMIEPLGRELLLSLKIGTHIIKAIVPPDIRLKIGGDAWMHFDDKKLHMFDSKTKKRVA